MTTLSPRALIRDYVRLLNSTVDSLLVWHARPNKVQADYSVKSFLLRHEYG